MIKSRALVGCHSHGRGKRAESNFGGSRILSSVVVLVASGHVKGRSLSIVSCSCLVSKPRLGVADHRSVTSPKTLAQSLYLLEQVHRVTQDGHLRHHDHELCLNQRAILESVRGRWN